MGCPITVTETDGVFSVKGNSCKRGEVYGIGEFTAPVRTVTALVRTKNGGVASVKTSSPVPKDMIFDILDGLKKITAPKNSRIGDVLVKNVLGTGSDIVVTGGN
jgi:CxxC motif-containing protein